VGLRENLEAMLSAGQDNALLRYSLGNECLKAGDNRIAAEHFQAAVQQNPGYAAAWRQLGRALEACGDPEGALRAWDKGRETAADSGDLQAGKEMAVFAGRLRKRLGRDPAPGG